MSKQEKANKANKEDKVEMIDIRTLIYKGEELLVMGLFSHRERNYVTIDVKTSDGVPYTICDRNDTLYSTVKKYKIPATELANFHEVEKQCLK